VPAIYGTYLLHLKRSLTADEFEEAHALVECVRA